MTAFERTARNEVKRVPARGAYDHETVFAVIDSAWIGHVGITGEDGAATVIPMIHARVDDGLIFHGARSSRLLRYLASGRPVCVSFAIVDGLVLAKSLFHHSMNYRSAVVFGSGTELIAEAEVDAALKAISDKVMPGRWDDAREPIAKELAATSVVRVKIESASAKIRIGPPLDEPEDLELPVWSGVLPIRSQMDDGLADDHSQQLACPDYVSEFREKYNGAG